jgi:hypothetical protein
MAELCKTCIFYDTDKRTCAKLVTAVSRGRMQYGYAKMARDDPNHCGPSARFRFPIPSPILRIDPFFTDERDDE